MVDLPELIHLTKRRLELQYDRLCADNGLGERARFSLPESEREERTFAFAKNRFADVVSEYWQLWASSTDKCDIFQQWLQLIEKRVLSEVGAVWSGGPKTIDRWFARLCRPKVEAQTAKLLTAWSSRARDEEMRRIERLREPDPLKRRITCAEDLPSEEELLRSHFEHVNAVLAANTLRTDVYTSPAVINKPAVMQPPPTPVSGQSGESSGARPVFGFAQHVTTQDGVSSFVHAAVNGKTVPGKSKSSVPSEITSIAGIQSDSPQQSGHAVPVDVSTELVPKRRRLLKAYCRRNNMTQEDFAKQKLKVHPTVLRGVTNGTYLKGGKGLEETICTLLGIELAVWFSL